ncbi:MAG: YtxH domain-containing protein [Armatimonadetes bacterium]|nr:YtxH domain-containing protein [Armatimonadota bacterium]
MEEEADQPLPAADGGAAARPDESDSLIELLAGVAVGILLGGLGALLLAPQSGRETRHQLRESTDDTLERLRTAMEELKERVEELASSHRKPGAPPELPVDRRGREPHQPMGGSAVGDPDDS